jgi:hypothetical protein
MFKRLGIRRYRPASTASVDLLRTEVSRIERHLERQASQHQRTVKSLEESVAILRRQSEEVLRELRATTDKLAQLTLRESQLRAVLRRDGELDPERARLEAVLARDGMANHVTSAIRGATLHAEPFPHVIVDELLPRVLYKALLRGLPPVELFADKPVNKQQIAVPFDFGPAYGRRVWRFMTDMIVRQWVAPAVLEKFDGPIRAWVAAHWPDIDPTTVELCTSDGRIMLRRRGYRILPHRDPKWGFITCLLYLARPEDSDTWGTQLYAVNGDAEARGDAPHWINEQQCRLVNDVAFRSNRMLVFLNSAGAHGASIPEDAPETLERYLYQFRVGPTAEAVGKLSALLPPERRPFWMDAAIQY